MNTDTTPPAAEHARTGLRWPQVMLIVLATLVITAGITYWVLSQTLFLKAFSPVELKVKETQVLDGKLRALGIGLEAHAADRPLEPERYSEVGAKREVSFSERELNALLARNTDLAQKLAIDLSDDLISAKLLVPLEADFPVLGGKTLRVNAGVELAYKDQRPIVVLKGVSLMGVPIPNAWLGNLKNVDLVQTFGGDQGFWKSFSDGVEYLHVEDGRLLIKLKE
ncbi:MAG: arginine N-succinyltransferase [Gammaproteobacteria bacterium]